MRVLLILLVYLIVNFYIGWHGFLLFSYSATPVSPVVYWPLFWIFAFSYLLGRMRFLSGPVGRLLKVIGSYYFAVMQFAVLFLPFADLAAWILYQSGFEPGKFVPVLSLIVVGVMILLLLRGSWNAWSPVTRTHTLNIDKRAGNLQELRIAVASDIHLGNTVGKRHLRRLVERMNALQPDLILLVGDVLDDSIEPFIRNRMSEVMKQLKANFGIYAVLGNHEYYGGHIKEYVKRMSEIGIRVLQDESVLVNDSLYVVGRKDKTVEQNNPNGRLSVQSLLEGLDLAHPVILMDHQPYQLDKAADAGIDLLLCGHTHRGQLAPNHWITGRIFELDWGYLKKGKMHAVVSSGFGTWGPPIRLGSRSEIIELVIQFQK